MPEFHTQPWTHQLRSFNFAYHREASYLALDMGTGKSKVAIDLAANWQSQATIIICPLSVGEAWIKQLSIHHPGPYIAETFMTGPVKQRATRMIEMLQLATHRRVPAFVIVNYDAVWRSPFGPVYNKNNRITDKGLILGMAWDLAILDEGHRIKTPSSRVSWFCRSLRNKAQRRLVLSGTPMPHSPLDIYAQMRFLNPDVFGTSFNLFRQEYAVLGGENNRMVFGFKHLDDLHAKFAAHSIRFMASDVLDLPAAIHQERTCKLCPAAMAAYRDLKKVAAALVEAGEITAANGAVKLLRLQQITGGNAALDSGEAHRIDDSKQRLLQDVFEDLPLDEPIVVFARFTADLDRIAEACENTGRAYRELSGRVKELSEWQNGNGNVLALQIQAGGVGIDLTRARYCIYYSVGYSLGDYEQSLKRTHRPGQTRTVFYYHLTAEGTVDQDVYAALEAKADVINAVLTGIVSK